MALAVAALVVVVAAVATVLTAGGALAGIAAVGAVLAGGAAATLGSTIAAGVFVGSFVAFTGFAAFAGIEAIKSGSIETFADIGESAMWSTITGGVLGGFNGVITYKANNTFYGTKTPGKSTPYSTYNNIKGNTITHYDGSGDMWWSKHLTDHNRPDLHTIVPHWHWENPHDTNYMSRLEFITEFLKRLWRR